MARMFEVTFVLEFGEDISAVDAANEVASALDFGELDHTTVFVAPLDENDGSRLGSEWIGEDDEDEDGVGE